jgi:hypothetical protein
VKEGVRTVLASEHPIGHALFEMQADLAKAAANAHVTQLENIQEILRQSRRELG